MNARISVAFVVAGLTLAASPAFAEDELAPFAKAIEANPDDAKAYEAYGTKALVLGRFDDAIAKLKVGVARVPDFGNGYYMLAYAFRKKQAWADAADYYRRCIMLHQKENESYFGLGQSLAGLGDKKGAIAAFKKYIAQEKRPNMQKFIDEANLQLAKLEPPALPPPSAGGDAAALRAQADSLRNEKKFDEAAVAYRKAIDADKGNLQLYNDLGYVYFALKRYNDAAQAFRESVERDPSYALGWYNLGHALRKGDRKGEAVEAIKRYIKLKPEDPDPYYGLGQTLKALGDAPGAIAAFRKYIDMEKRPDEQKWVEKARQELSALEAPKEPPSSQGSGKILDEKSALDAARSGASDEAGASGAQPERPRKHLRDLHDPFQQEPREDSSSGGGLPPAGVGPLDTDGLIDPFRRQPTTMPTLVPEGPVSTQRVRDYGRAVSAFRRALAAQAEEVSVRFDRGAQLALAGRPREAVAAWNAISLDDVSVSAARKSVEQVRTAR